MTIRVSARIAHWAIRLASVGIVLGFFGFSQPVVQACNNVYCEMGGETCDADEHHATVLFFGTRNGDEHGSCIQAACDVSHAQCGVPLPTGELDVLEHAAVVGDRSTVESILDEYSSLTVNIERSALQQLDCAGGVLTHIPVTSTLIGDLAAVAQR